MNFSFHVCSLFIFAHQIFCIEFVLVEIITIYSIVFIEFLIYAGTVLNALHALGYFTKPPCKIGFLLIPTLWTRKVGAQKVEKLF